jgi:membrane protease YdiL (CAAX protease family)
MEPPSPPSSTIQPRKLPHPVPWTRRDMTWAVVVGIVAVLALLLLVSLGLRLVGRVLGVPLPSSSRGTVILFAELGLLFPVWLFGPRKYALPWNTIGFRGFNVARAAGLGCVILLGSLGFNLAWSLFLGLFQLQVQPDVLPAFGEGLQGLSQAILVGGLVAPIAEEAFFRGYLYAGLRSHYGRVAAVVLSAALFATAHILPTSWPPVFLLGALFSLLYEQTDSLWPAVILHGMINSLGFVASYVLNLLSS